MQMQTQCPNFVCVCVCHCVHLWVCVCVHALSDDVIVARKRIAFCRDEGAELKQQTERNKNWRRKWRENTQERMHESEKEGRDEEKLQRNKCRNKETESQPRNLLLSPHLSALSCRKCKKIIIEIISVGWTSWSVTHPAAMLAPALLCSHWRSAAQQHQHHHTAAQYMTSPTSPLIGQQGCWAAIGPAGQRRRRRGGGGGVGLFQRKPPDQ